MSPTLTLSSLGLEETDGPEAAPEEPAKRSLKARPSGSDLIFAATARGAGGVTVGIMLRDSRF
jgi:hypothetical protein